MTDEALDIMNAGTEVSSEQLRMIDQDADLRKACEDIFVAQNVLAREQMPAADADEQLRLFHQRRRRARLRYIGAAILSAAAVLVAAVFLLKPKAAKEQGLFFEAVSEQQQPTITTDDGTTVPIRMVAQAGHPDRRVVVDTDQMEVEQLRLNVPVGQSLQVDLPDGSKVFMHPGSRIVYPNHFIGDKREVKFSGQAYFVVARDVAHPFVVTTAKSQTTVLGTEFDITAYEGRPEYITLISGKVSCRLLNGEQATDQENRRVGELWPQIHEVILTPGQQLSIVNSQLTVRTLTDTDQFTSWRDGYFYFDNIPLRDILREIGQYYNVSIVSLRPWLLDYRMRFIVPREKGIDYVVKTLNRMEKVNAKLHHNRLYINPKQE
ncbi:MAG: FecR domain-containing protein [Prevotella sp.]|nr:FecR domain-containing protein [Prevotella sp.]